MVRPRCIDDIARDAASLARATAERLRGTLDEDAVHDVRVATKRLRAAWRWIGWERPSFEVDHCVEALRNLSRGLSGSRDRDVLHELQKKFGGELRDLPEVAEAGDVASMPGVLEEDAKAWDDVADICSDVDVTPRGLRRAFRRARQTGREAIVDGPLESWHEWRKAVKRLLYQLEIVKGHTNENTHELKKLGRVLGDHQDLAVFVRHTSDAAAIARAEEVAAALRRDARGRFEPLFGHGFGELVN